MGADFIDRCGANLVHNLKRNKMELKGKNDIERAIFLLREIDAFFSFNISPPAAQITEMRKTISEFTAHFPDCWDCGDTGFVGYYGDQKCKCNRP